MDQTIKIIIIDGFRWDSKVISIVLVYNNGVAFSMLSFLENYLKWIQIICLISIMLYTRIKKEIIKKHYLGLSCIFGGGISNIIDRFLHIEGVVDYIYWHYLFDFAIFNLADAMINMGVFILILKWFWLNKTNKRQLS